MKSKSNTEKEMREEKVPWPKTEAELNEYIDSLVNRDHDYGTAVYAMSMAAAAAFFYVSQNLRVTGFQASCADLDFIRRTRSIRGPFIILKAEEMIYPQYDLPSKLANAMTGWKSWAAEECKKLLVEKAGQHVHPDVVAHWHKLAAFQPAPEGTPDSQ
jgi:hypothetical protein